jgi:homoprotocatechuate degradation regulator HpaR
MSQRALRRNPTTDDADQAEPRLVQDFSRSLPMALLRAREAVMLRLRPVLRAHGVTEQQWRVLRTLANTEGLEATQLARQVFLLRPSLTRILRDLQKRGLVGRRATGPSLRRSVVFITETGLALIDEAAPEAALANAEIETLVGVEDVAALMRVLFRLEGVLNGLPTKRRGPST